MNKKVVVIGGMNIDMLAKSYQPFQVKDSNPGSHIIDAGGVGFNIAYNLKLLQYEVTLFTVVGDDVFGYVLKEACHNQQIQLFSPPSDISSLYVSLFDDRGQMTGAIASMDAMHQLTPDYLKRFEEVLLNSDVLICDTNVSTEVLSYLASLNHPFKVVELVSQEKSKKIKTLISGFHWIKGNQKEVHQVFQDSIQTKIRENQTVILTNQEHFSRRVTKEIDQQYHFENISDIVNVSGAGDAFLVGCIDGFFKEKEILKQGHLMALCALKSKTSKMLKECDDANQN